MTGDPTPEAGGPRLIWFKSDGGEAVFPLGAVPLTVGREEPAEIVIDEPLVSRGHARIERSGDAYVVIDLGSTNGTRVNGVVVQRSPLRNGDEVRFARARCVFSA